MVYTPLIDQLIHALRALPGVGPKTAQRMAFYLLQHGRANGLALANILEQSMQHIGNCKQCRALSETELCQICSNPRRDNTLLCIVESPSDIIAIEQTSSYQGLYFVLMGRLSPLDGMGPENLGIPLLLQFVQQKSFKEVIVATNPTVEGEATAHYIASLLRSHSISCTRLAYGIPMGGELDCLDGNTISRALHGRSAVE